MTTSNLSSIQIFKRISLILLVAVTALILIGYYFLFHATFNAVNTTHQKVTIERGLSYRGILKTLQDNRVINHREPLLVLAYLYPNKTNIKPGRYNIPPNLSSDALLTFLYEHKQDELKLRVPEGVRLEVVAKWVASNMDFTTDEFMSACQDTALLRRYNIHEKSAEGYLLPDTYKIPWGLTAEETAEFLLRKFVTFFDKTLKKKAESKGFSIHDVLTLASIVEAESPLQKERPLIAGVYLNRLRIGMRLQADPTIQYALGGQPRRLLYKDLEIDSPYNTYKYKGLPPGPIGNPSKSSILAVLNPQPSDYYYFVATGSGGHNFSKTAAEHQRHVNKYRRVMRKKRREARLNQPR